MQFQTRGEKRAGLIALAIWLLGAAAIFWLWNNRIFVREWMEGLFGFALYIVAFFYFLAYPFLYHRIYWRHFYDDPEHPEWWPKNREAWRRSQLGKRALRR